MDRVAELFETISEQSDGELIKVLGIIALLLFIWIVSFLMARRQRRLRLDRRLRDEWGKREAESALDGDELRDVAAYWRGLRKACPMEGSLDDLTWSDLDMDALFQRLNRTQSNAGAEVLYAMLRDVSVPDDDLARRARWIRAIGKDDERRLSMQKALSSLGRDRYRGVYPLLFRPIDKVPGHAWVYYTLAALPFLFFAMGFINPIWFAGLALSFVANLIVHYRTHSQWSAEAAGVRHLAAVLRCARRLGEYRMAGMEDASEQLNRVKSRLKAIARWNALYMMEPRSELDFLTVYFRIAFQLDMLSLIGLTRFIRANADEVRRAYALVGEMDACIAVASVRAAFDGWCEPEFVGALRVTAEDVVHPLVKNPVPNSMNWQKNALVTGSNAAGKSTFIKALAVNAALAQSIHTCFAGRLQMPRARVMSSMALRDSVQGGDSYFIVEIKSLRRILSAISDDVPTLCFIDEILRGTNTVERIATSSALLAYLDGKNALCIAATHDIELTRLLEHYAQYHFREEMTGEGMAFSYKLMDGPSTTRNAIALLEQMDFPGDITETAEMRAKMFDNTGQWTSRERGWDS